jgi:hypothetical protein
LSEFLWHWKKGNSKIYTKKSDVAEKAMKDGVFVVGIRIKPKILKF